MTEYLLMLARKFIVFYNYFIIYYIMIVSSIYIVLFYFSFTFLKKERGLNRIEPYKQLKQSNFTPPLSVLVPAYNEEAGIVGSVLSLITGSGRLDYPEFEVIVINDGSTDGTLKTMIERFQMKEVKDKVFERKNGITTKPIIAQYESDIYPYLKLIDKENGGKSDALNAGINVAKYPYFASIDGDTILEPDSLLKIMKPIIENRDDEIIASGGNVLIANGSTIEKGHLQQHTLSNKLIVIMQVIDYFRAFLLGRIGLSQKNLLLLISGAFSVFKTSRVIEAGGYKVGMIGEDMEIVVRLHKMNIEKGWGAKIKFVADPVCYTEAPENFRDLRKQRMRWHRGLFDSLRLHKEMIFNPKYKAIGLFAMPYYLIIELFGPMIEILGYVAMILGFLLGAVHVEISILLFILLLFYGSILSMGAILLEEWRLRKYNTISELNRLLLCSLTESLWYRPLLALWRVQALISALFKREQSWGTMRRKGVSS